ncbi:MAG: protein phosphatase 2C domain-containing protein [Dehalococcoidia bacterium]
MRVSFASEPGEEGRPNEDWVGATPDVAVVLDGLSSAPGADSGCRHGTPWYVARLGGRLLVTAGDPALSLPDALAAAIEQVAGLHPECDLTHPGTPSATVAILRTVRPDDVEYLVLGDARIVLATSSGVEAITDERVELVAQAERDAVYREPIGSESHERAVAELIATQKPLRNRPGGYWVAATEPAVASHALTGAAPAAQMVDAALLTDGASRIVDMFGQITWSDLMAIVREAGPWDIIAQVRAIEETDLEGMRWPRYKTADDASITYMVEWP